MKISIFETIEIMLLITLLIIIGLSNITYNKYSVMAEIVVWFLNGLVIGLNRRK